MISRLVAGVYARQPGWPVGQSADLWDVTSPIRVTVWGENFHEQSERGRAGMTEQCSSGMQGASARPYRVAR
jgi:hypothetical protein